MVDRVEVLRTGHMVRGEDVAVTLIGPRPTASAGEIALGPRRVGQLAPALQVSLAAGGVLGCAIKDALDGVGPAEHPRATARDLLAERRSLAQAVGDGAEGEATPNVERTVGGVLAL